MVSFGGASGWPESVSLDLMSSELTGSRSLVNPRLYDYLATAEELNTRATDVFNWIAEGKIKMVFTVLPLSEAKKAHDMLQGKKTTGKVLLKP